MKFLKRKIESIHGPWYPSHENYIPERISIQILESTIPYYKLHKFNWTTKEQKSYTKEFSF